MFNEWKNIILIFDFVVQVFIVLSSEFWRFVIVIFVAYEIILKTSHFIIDDVI